MQVLLKKPTKPLAPFRMRTGYREVLVPSPFGTGFFGEGGRPEDAGWIQAECGGLGWELPSFEALGA